jgi:hypothetical protein
MLPTQHDQVDITPRINAVTPFSPTIYPMKTKDLDKPQCIEF